MRPGSMPVRSKNSVVGDGEIGHSAAPGCGIGDAAIWSQLACSERRRRSSATREDSRDPPFAARAAACRKRASAGQADPGCDGLPQSERYGCLAVAPALGVGSAGCCRAADGRRRGFGRAARSRTVPLGNPLRTAAPGCAGRRPRALPERGCKACCGDEIDRRGSARLGRWSVLGAGADRRHRRCGAGWAAAAAALAARHAAAGDPGQGPAHAFHDELLVIITLITLFVLGLLLYVMLRFHHTRNPVPTRTSHNTVIEILWTVVPVLILVIIAIPSFKLMYYMDRVPNAGHDDQGHRPSVVLDLRVSRPGRPRLRQQHHSEDTDLKPGQKRLLEVDNPLVVPVDTMIRVLGHRHRRDPQLVRAVLRRPGIRDRRPPQRDLDEGRARRRLLRPVQPDLRHQPRLHADQGRGGVEGRFPELAGEAKKKFAA